ncbi:DoxX family protein [Mucilaginibacter sp. 14171R-50]|uniref:DoxX family protein n=1 Tax=Mucilaginibacter sp. 14171R-50 TaxID=2703789 RepID=UPI00138C7975|nr:DoxX family protein [Mucilaginibacter sp. 14171R-50]QHS56094.1 DoxX family protein [Mucilaginibacter sp. 14171R-50]
MIHHKDFFIVLIRLFLGYIFLSSGLCKLTNGHFGQIIGPPLFEAMLAKYGLALFARVVATLQVVCGILLLSQRFSTIGAIMLVPMNLSIFAVTISLNWQGTPYVNGFFTLLNVLLLIYDWHKLKILVNPKRASSVKPTIIDAHTYNIYNIAGMVFAAVAIIASRYDIIFTNAFAIAAFVCFGYAIIQVKAVTKMQAIIVALVMLNMIMITLAGRFGLMVQKLVLYNTLVVLLLISLSFIKRLNPVDKPAVT